MIFPVVMYVCESWTIKKAECQRTDAFELWCWRRLLRARWTARRSNQSILKKSVLNIHWKDWRWSWNSNTLATWCEALTYWKRPWCWERLKAAEGDDRGWDGWLVSPTQWTWVWASSGSWWWIGKPGMLQFMGLQSRTWLSVWTELNWTEEDRRINACNNPIDGLSVFLLLSGFKYCLCLSYLPELFKKQNYLLFSLFHHQTLLRREIILV